MSNYCFNLLHLSPHHHISLPTHIWLLPHLCLATSFSQRAKSSLCEAGFLSARRHKKAIKETEMERKNIYCTTLAVLFDKRKTEGRKLHFTSLSCLSPCPPSSRLCPPCTFVFLLSAAASHFLLCLLCDRRKNTNRFCAEPKSKTERKDRQKQEI